MTDQDRKMLGLGNMVFEMITDLFLMPPGHAYSRKTITMPDGKGGKHKVEMILARPATADRIEQLVSKDLAVTDIQGTGGKPV